MSSDLKPGDRALVVTSLNFLRAWDVVSVQSSPYWVDDYCGRYDCGCALVVDVPEAITGRVAARHLIRIPPDSEMRQMFRETEKPRGRVSEQEAQR